jgi:hypothetical protein
MGAEDGWGSRDPGPVVRPYAVTGGRTEPADGEILDLIAVIVASPPAASPSAASPSAATPSAATPSAATPRAASPSVTGGDEPATALGPEHRKILSMCQQQVTVADLASDTALPLGVIRVLLADLMLQGRITLLPQPHPDEQPSAELLKEVLHGLRAL